MNLDIKSLLENNPRIKAVFKGDFKALFDSIFKNQEKIIQKLDDISKKDNSVFIENPHDIKLPEFPNELYIKNFPEQKEVKFPETQKVEVKKPSWWTDFTYEKILLPISLKFDEIRNTIAELKNIKGLGDTPKEAMHVVLVDKDKKGTYNAVAGGSGGGQPSVWLTDSSGNRVTVTGNKLDVNATLSTGGLATGSQPIGTVSLGAGGALVGTVSIQGTITASDNVYADTTPLVVGSTLGKPAIGAYQGTALTTLADGALGIMSIDINRRQIMTLGGAGTIVMVSVLPALVAGGAAIGSVALLGIPQVTGFVTLAPGAVSIGSVALLGIPQVTGFMTLVGNSAVTGFITLVGSSAVTGFVTLVGTSQITGFTGISGTPAITGFVGISGTPAVTGFMSIAGIPQVTGFVAVDQIVLANGALSLGVGGITCPTPGTAIQFPAQACRYMMITGIDTNTNPIYIGGSAVVAGTTPQLTKGFGVWPAQTHKIEVSNLNLLYIDSLSINDGVAYAWFN